MTTQPTRLVRWHRHAAAILSLLALPLADGRSMQLRYRKRPQQ